jgi:hypothetical protein
MMELTPECDDRHGNSVTGNVCIGPLDDRPQLRAEVLGKAFVWSDHQNPVGSRRRSMFQSHIEHAFRDRLDRDTDDLRAVATRYPGGVIGALHVEDDDIVRETEARQTAFEEFSIVPGDHRRHDPRISIHVRTSKCLRGGRRRGLRRR